MAQWQNRNARSQANLGRTCSSSGEQDGGIGDETAVPEKVMFVEHEAFPAQFLSQFGLFENLLVILVMGRVEIRKVCRQDVDVESHRPRCCSFGRGVQRCWFDVQSSKFNGTPAWML